MKNLLSDLTVVKYELIDDGSRQSARVIKDAIKEIEKLSSTVDELKKENEILTLIAGHV